MSDRFAPGPRLIGGISGQTENVCRKHDCRLTDDGYCRQCLDEANSELPAEAERIVTEFIREPEPQAVPIARRLTVAELGLCPRKET